MKAFVINLKKDKDRRAFMKNQLIDLGIDYEFIEAFYAKEKTETEISKIYESSKSKNINGHDLSLAEIGCAYSHTLAYQKMIDQKLHYALILEDDVKIDKRLLEVIKMVKNKHDEPTLPIRKVPERQNGLDFDWLQIDYVQPGIFFWKHWCSLFIKEIKNNFNSIKSFKTFIKFLILIIYMAIKFIYISLLSVYEGLRNYFYKSNYKFIKNNNSVTIVNFYRPLYLASAYIISNEGAHKLLKINTPVIVTADRLPNYARVNKYKDIDYKSRDDSNFIMKAISPLITEQQRKVFLSNIVDDKINNYKLSIEATIPNKIMNKYVTKIKRVTYLIYRTIRYVCRHLFARPVYLYNYMSKYFDNDYIEPLKFYSNDKLKELLKHRSVIRIGDGELHMHNGGDIACYQKYNKRLSNYYKKIIREYTDKSPYILGVPMFAHQSNRVLREKNLINCWMPLKATIRTYFNRDTHYADAHAFYRYGGFDNILRPILESHKIIMITGEHNVKMLESDSVNIHDKLDIEFISTPEVESFDKYDDILDRFYKLAYGVKNEYIKNNSSDSLKNNDFSEKENKDLQDVFNKEYRILVSTGPASKAIVYELSKLGYICYDIGKGVETMYQENKVQYMIG